ncbi:MAG: biopolymer transporter ExbD [Nitrospirota bacterium]|nr:biopolymer transporter ExbD [Nitrospirales bacterium]
MTTGSKPRQFLSEINVIPLVDVVLVLLVIFMVTAPMLHRGLDINLPTTTANNIKAEERLIVTIQRDHTLSLGNDTISLVNLRSKLQEAKILNPLISVYLRADQTVPYGTVVQVMDEVKGAKIERLGMITGPKVETIIEDETIGVSR